MDRTSLEGKRVLVTGGTTGIGRATVALLAQQGARIVTFGRHDAELQVSLDHARETPGARVAGLTADIATPEGVAQVFAAVDREMGGLDILVNNAGLSVEGVQDETDADWRYAVETNFVAYLACAREAIGRMRVGGGGHILFVGSISADRKLPGNSTYAATKAGIATYAETLRKEVARDRIKISWIEPGATGADMQAADPAMQRQKIEAEEMLMAEDIADAIAFILTRPSRTDILALRIEPRFQGSD